VSAFDEHHVKIRRRFADAFPSTCGSWVSALDPDSSVAAVTLEHGLDIALERAPALIAEALRGPMSALIREELRRQRQETLDDAESPAQPDRNTQ
jgi:hypothetical protein